MARLSRVPRFVRMGNVLIMTLLRLGFKLVGPGNSPMYLLTVRGRKSGQPRTTPIALVEQEGRCYLFAPYGVVDWTRNLRAAGTAILTRGRRTEQVRAVELPSHEAAAVLKGFLATGNPIARFFPIAAEASQKEFEQLAKSYPVFMMQPQ